MAASIDTYLRNLSYKYYLKNDSTELSKINSSLKSLTDKLWDDKGILLKRIFVFGSYDRDTILPRKFDSKSDIDIMVVFKHTDYERTPETYRSWLKIFADKYYKDRYGSDVVKSFPTVSIRLNHIHYDLVPAKEEYDWLYNPTIYIPGNYGWRSTDPEDVKKKLTAANTEYKQIVRPIIRILKAWNGYNGYPYDSYLLELEITKMNFYNDNIQSGFFYAAKKLYEASYGEPISKRDKLQKLSSTVENIKTALKSDNSIEAKRLLHKILPEP